MAGQSTTAVLAVALCEVADPAVKVPDIIVAQRSQIAKAMARDTPGLASFWRQEVQAAKARQARACHAVKGPMGATSATLLAAGWEPEECDRWIGSRGDIWQAAEEAGEQCSMRACDRMLRAFRRDVRQQRWQRCSLAG